MFGNLPDYPETQQTIQALFRLSGNFTDHPETFQFIPNFFQVICKFSRLFGNLPDYPETSQCNFKGYAQKLSGRAKTFRMAMPRCHDGFWASASYGPRFSELIQPYLGAVREGDRVCEQHHLFCWSSTEIDRWATLRCCRVYSGLCIIIYWDVSPGFGARLMQLDTLDMCKSHD